MKNDSKLAEKSTFFLDGDVEFTGYHFGETWNGWAVPYFERDEADRLMDHLNEGDHMRVEFLPADGARENSYVIHDLNYGEVERVWPHTINTVDGERTVYPIGAYGWCWWNDNVYDEYWADRADFEEMTGEHPCINCGFDLGDGYSNCGASEDGTCPECGAKNP